MAFLVGPLLGGLLVDSGSWRLIFAINVIPVGITLWLLRSLKDQKPVDQKPRVDWIGASFCVVGLGGPVYALIEQPYYGWSNPLIYTSLFGGLAALFAFILYERSAQDPIIIKQAGDAAEGFVYSYTFDSTSKQAEQFIQKFQKKYGREPDAYAAEGYEAYKLIVAAFNECDKNTGCIKEFFKKPQQTVFGEVTFDAKGDPIYAFHMKTIRNGTFVKLE